jgi:Ca2+-binding RTX toxin-like protein
MTQFVHPTGNDRALLSDGDDQFVWNPGDGSDIVDGQRGVDLLDFNGSGASETIDLSANGGRVRFARDVASIVTDLHDVEAVDFHAAGGADTITSPSTTSPAPTRRASTSI